MERTNKSLEEIGQSFTEKASSEEFAEEKEKFRNISKEFAHIFDAKNTETLSLIFSETIKEWRDLESRDGSSSLDEDLNWYDENNHRINLYQIAGMRSDEWDNDGMAKEKGDHLLAFKKIDACLKQFAKATDPSLASEKLGQVIKMGQIPEHNLETAVDTLARLGVAGGGILERLIGDEEIPPSLRLRAILSTIRFGQSFPTLKDESESILLKSIDSSDPRILTGAIELCGLLGGVSGRDALNKIGEKIKTIPLGQQRWLELDSISTELAIDPDRAESIGLRLGGRMWEAPSGIFFGSLQAFEGFDDFIFRNKLKLVSLAEALKRTNDSFGSEPVLYVDIVPDDVKNTANEGWTQNSIHLSKSMIEHPQVSTKITVQGAIHEACERWESKGFVDAQMESDYMSLLGEEYGSSPLDKFRLSHRYDVPTHAGHPWDGTREYVAEAGSILLAEPDEEKKIFDPARDRSSLSALEYVHGLIQMNGRRKGMGQEKG
jgi:hypothetical protein